MSDILYATFPDHAGAPQYPRLQGKPSKLTKAEKKDLEATSKKRWDDIQADLDKWLAYTEKFAEQMAIDHGHTACVYLDAMFFRQTNPHNKTNAWNAFIS